MSGYNEAHLGPTVSDGDAAHDFKTKVDADRHRGRIALSTEIAKLGLDPAGANVMPGGTKAELHEQRKGMRRAANALNDSIGYNSPTTLQMDALTYVSSMVGKIESLLEGLDDDPKRTGPQPMRTAADFRAHYRQQGAGGFAANELDLADFLRGVAGLGASPAVKNALSVGTDSSGGFAVPSILMPQILAAMAPASSLLQAGAGIVPLMDGAKSFTYPAVATLPTAAWRSENGAVAESDPVFRAVTAAPKSLAVLFKISRELLADAPGLSEALFTALGQSFAREIDRVGLRGSGIAPVPLGLLGTAGVQPVTNGANGTALAGYGNIFSAAQAILQADCPLPTAAIMSPRSLVKLGGLVDSTGQPLRVPGMLEPVRMLATSQIPNNLTVGSSTDCTEIFIGSFDKLQFLMRESISIQMLSELFAGNGQIAFVAHARIDVAVLYAACFAVVTGVRA